VALSVVALLGEVFTRRFLSGRVRRARPKKVIARPAVVTAPSVRPLVGGGDRRGGCSPRTPAEKPGVKSALEVAGERARKRLRR